jgi:glyoxylase-like metal-dependent hydrolase (beta-lactamase superfamily II)
MTPTLITDNIYQVPIPIPYPLKTVNCYLVRDPDGWTMIDTGMRTPAGLAAWDAAFQTLGITPADVHRIYLTHLHPDHFGLAGYFQQLSGAPVYMLRLEAESVSLFWNVGGPSWGMIAELWTHHGMPADLARMAADQAYAAMPMLMPHPNVTPLDEGAEVELAGRPYRVVWTPGHSDGHYVLYGWATRLLFAGDHLLVRITPNIGLWPNCDPDPLRSYLASLHKVTSLDVDLVLSGHRTVFTNMRDRIAELLAHHDRRAALCEQLADGGNTAFAISRGVFGNDLSLHDTRFAMVETLAHLEYLAALGRLERVDNGVVTYRRSRV